MAECRPYREWCLEHMDEFSGEEMPLSDCPTGHQEAIEQAKKDLAKELIDDYEKTSRGEVNNALSDLFVKLRKLANKE